MKALADVVQISGNNGGTGASPLSSIKNAGMPWELGLADTQQALIENDLRDRVRVRVDGGFKTGRDVVIAALLGADEYSFGTAAMLAEGCIMVRACHRDTCPTGIATQRPNLRAKFSGHARRRRHVHAVRRRGGARSCWRRSGCARLDEAIGRVELLRQRTTGDARADALDLSPLLVPPADEDAPRHFVDHVPIQRPRSALDERLLADGFAALWEGGDVELEYEITNADRTSGASLGGAIGLEWGDGLPPGSVTARFTGVGRPELRRVPRRRRARSSSIGEANDYLGKGMGGGRIVGAPARRRRRRSRARRQHRAVRRDRRAGVRRRPGRRALRGAQQRRDRGGRGRRRPRVRVHDRRHVRHPRARSATTSAPG